MFKRLDADTVAFRLSFPRDLRAALKRDVSEAADLDIYLLLAHQVAHVSTILLHESFCTVKVNDPSMARCSSSARAILVYLMSDSARAMSILNPFTSFCWSIAGRTMIREIAIHSHRGDTQAAAHGEAMVRHFLHRLSSVAQNKLTHTVVGMLTSLLSNNSSCLPRFGRQFTCAEDEERTNAELFDVDAPRSMHAYASGQPMMPMGAMGSSRRMTEQATMQAAYAAPPAATKSGEQRFATINTPSGSSQEAKTPSEGVEFTTSSMLLEYVSLSSISIGFGALTCAAQY